MMQREMGVGFVRRPSFGFGRLALLAAMIAAAGLAGCGRKGGLDLPPTATLTNPQQQPDQSPSLGSQSDSSAPSLLAPQPAPQPAPPPPAKKGFLLDFLLN
jgi:predicted small lipoprotein YifL